MGTISTVGNLGTDLRVGYWTTNLLDVNQHFGSAADIKQLSDELHKRDMVCTLNTHVDRSY